MLFRLCRRNLDKDWLQKHVHLHELYITILERLWQMLLPAVASRNVNGQYKVILQHARMKNGVGDNIRKF